MTYRYERWAAKHLDVVLGKGNEEQYARCPFKQNHKHGDHNPSFGVNVKKGVFYCHGCHERGTFRDLAEKLRVGLQEETPDLEELNDTIDKLLGESGDPVDDVKVYPESWLNQFEAERQMITEYWSVERQISRRVVASFRLGYDTLTNSATIPIRNFHGKPLGVIRRRMAKNAKPRYMYPKGFKITEHLWGSHAVVGEHTIAVCEGSVDALACWSAGIPAVALLGSRISTHQVHLLNKIGPTEVVVLPDRDKPGREAAVRVAEAVSGCLVSVGKYRSGWSGKDPADLTRQQLVAMFECA